MARKIVQIAVAFSPLQPDADDYDGDEAREFWAFALCDDGALFIRDMTGRGGTKGWEPIENVPQDEIT